MIKSLWGYWRNRLRRHAITEMAGWHGGYQCKCGLPWLIQGDRCMATPRKKAKKS